MPTCLSSPSPSIIGTPFYAFFYMLLPISRGSFRFGGVFVLTVARNSRRVPHRPRPPLPSPSPRISNAKTLHFTTRSFPAVALATPVRSFERRAPVADYLISPPPTLSPFLLNHLLLCEAYPATLPSISPRSLEQGSGGSGASSP